MIIVLDGEMYALEER